MAIAIGMTLYYKRENDRRDSVEGGAPEPGAVSNVFEEFDKARGYRYTL